MKPVGSMIFSILAGLAARDMPMPARQASVLQGSWMLVAADKRLPDGRVVRDYGEKPKGRLVVDARGRYSLQIFKSERLRFAGDKADGTAEEFQSAVMGSSTHYGTVVVDEKAGVLIFSIEGASFPNWEGTVQQRRYRLDGAELSYQVPARPDGSTPISVWRRLD